MSRQSAFVWRDVLDTASEEDWYPPRPADMDEPVWANLVFGGGNCTVGTRNVNHIYTRLIRGSL